MEVKVKGLESGHHIRWSYTHWNPPTQPEWSVDRLVVTSLVQLWQSNIWSHRTASAWSWNGIGDWVVNKGTQLLIISLDFFSPVVRDFTSLTKEARVASMDCLVPSLTGLDCEEGVVSASTTETLALCSGPVKPFPGFPNVEMCSVNGVLQPVQWRGLSIINRKMAQKAKCATKN